MNLSPDHAKSMDDAMTRLASSAITEAAKQQHGVRGEPPEKSVGIIATMLLYKAARSVARASAAS